MTAEKLLERGMAIVTEDVLYMYKSTLMTGIVCGFRFFEK